MTDLRTRQLPAIVLVIGAVVASAACGGSVEPTSSASGAGGATSSTTGNPCFPDSCNGPSVSAGPGSGGGGGVGAVCGGLAGATCPPDAFCDFPSNDCGGDDGTGVCTPRPTECGKNLSPTCGCDGMVYSNPCEAERAGVDASNLGCTPPQGTFSCGPSFCAIGTNYCMRSVSDVGGRPDSYSCVPLPAGCGASPTCACVASEPCGSLCDVSASGDITLTCPGG